MARGFEVWIWHFRKKKNGDKFYGYWNKGKKEGQGYYYYASNSKIYLGEWHDDVPRCGIFTDVDDENLKKNFPKGYLLDDKPSSIPTIKLKNSNGILENSINQVFFLRNIKTAKEKSINDLFDLEKLTQLMVFFSPNIDIEEKQVNKGKMPDSVIKLEEFRSICVENFGLVVDDETLEIIFHHFNISLNNVTIDFELFVRLFYLIGKKS